MNPLRLLLVLCSALLTWSVRAADPAAASPLVGAWRAGGAPERVMIVTPNYWTQAIYDREQRQFLGTIGGPYTLNGETTEARIDFDSEDPQRVGTQLRLRVRASAKELTVVQEDGTTETWTRLDAADRPLAGVWRISGRQADGGFREMPLRARRTLKVLSGTRFQWIAMNVETGEFSGTGGGTYTFENGRYAEHLEFFSRDGSRVGAQLEFEGAVEGDTWRHRGLSSRGEPIDEVWTRFAPAP